MARWVSRVGAGMVGCAALVAVSLVTMTSAAFGHVEVEAEPAIAGAENVTVTFSAEAESGSAGVASVRVVLPPGIDPTAVRLDQAPPGWILTATQDGYMVAGTALAVGADVVHSVVIARLPDETTLVFKTLVTYSDGAVDRWIEEPTSANPRPQNPAPVLQLQPDPRPRPTSSAPPSTPPGAPTPPASPPTAASAPDSGSGSGSNWVWWMISAVVVVGGAAAVVVARRARR